MSFLPLFLVVLALLGFVFLLLGVKIFFHRSQKFPETSVGHNPEMRKRGLSCARTTEIKQWSNKSYGGCKSCCGSDCE